MKLYGNQIDTLLNHEELAYSYILLFGPDQGLMHDCAKKIANKYLGLSHAQSSILSFSTSQVKDDPSTLFNAIKSLSLLNAKQIIRIRNGDDSLAIIFEELIDNDMSLWPIIIEAEELSPRSKIRRLFEKQPTCIAIGCYPDEGSSLKAFIQNVLRDHQLNPTDEALLFLCQYLGGDRLVIRSELEKVALYSKKDPNIAETLTSKDVESCISYSSIGSMDKINFAITGGQDQTADLLLIKALNDGVLPTTILRAIQNHFYRFYFVVTKIENGLSFETASSALRPPIFYKWRLEFKTQSKKWSSAKLQKALSLLLECEIKCKKTGMFPETLCSYLILKLSNVAKSLP